MALSVVPSTASLARAFRRAGVARVEPREKPRSVTVHLVDDRTAARTRRTPARLLDRTRRTCPAADHKPRADAARRAVPVEPGGSAAERYHGDTGPIPSFTLGPDAGR